MVGQEMKQGMVSAVVEEEHFYLPSYEEACRVEEEGTEMAASEERLDEALDSKLEEALDEALEEIKLEEVGTEMNILGEVSGENLDEVKVVEENAKLNSIMVVEVEGENP